MFEEVTIESKYIYKGKILNLRVDQVQLENGRTSSREIIEHNGAVAIVAVDGEDLIMVRQYRKAIEGELLEIPAGKLEDEDPLECAKRELKEETGYSADEWQYVCDFYSTPGFSNERMFLYYATDLKKGEMDPDEDELIKVERVKLRDALEMLKRGQFKDAKTIIGVCYAIRMAGI